MYYQSKAIGRAGAKAVDLPARSFNLELPLAGGIRNGI